MSRPMVDRISIREAFSPAARKCVPGFLILFLSSLLPATAANSSADPPAWWTDYEEARTYATEQGLPLLLFFHGSDWCTWCQKLEVELFDTSAFRDRLNRDLVAVSLDFPRRSRLPVAMERQNQKMKSAYSVEHFPTVLWLNPKTRAVFFRHSYLDVSPEDYLKILRKAAPKGSE